MQTVKDQPVVAVLRASWCECRDGEIKEWDRPSVQEVSILLQPPDRGLLAE